MLILSPLNYTTRGETGRVGKNYFFAKKSFSLPSSTSCSTKT